MCYDPITIVDEKTRLPQLVSCRRCIECMQTRANEWAVRGHYELIQHQQNCFITLTYDDKNNPVVLVKKHMQDFVKRLRKTIDPAKIKYFAAGEYGDQRLRPHFHIIIFGYDFNDKEYVRKSQSDLPIYESKQLQKLWKYGIAIVQEANANTIRYSAKYNAKLKNALPEHLQKFPEFNTMSQNLGIEGLIDNMETFIKTDQIYLDGFAYKIPNKALEKYALKKTGSYYERDMWVNEFKESRQYKYRNKEQRETAKRIALKKKQFAGLRSL